ncbi:MAG: GNAT family N-acetyltransferase [Pyrinomonadaceae bacterium MAG19_C2-C3]|nr:GNAT family N-acetyltransferase [Pyrinomonadaceae bacterium MAG19_C2-C3]
MTLEEFERSPARFGWKHEYWDGCAHLTPMETHVCAQVKVERHEFQTRQRIASRPVTADDADALIACFIETFEDGIEFCDWRPEDILHQAQHKITGYFAGKQGTPSDVSRCALTDDGEVIAAALIADHTDAAVLDLLMVHPRFRRSGLARTLATHAMNELHARGILTLRSMYAVCNEESTAWHEGFGFRELPDLHLAHLRRSYFAGETRRCEVDASATEAEREEVQRQYDFWQRRTAELEAICERDGFDAVTPLRQFTW